MQLHLSSSIAWARSTLFIALLAGGTSLVEGSTPNPTTVSASEGDVTSLDCRAAPDNPSATTPLVAVLKATRLSGPAPLAVLFDASCTLALDATSHTFHHVRYAFDFGDERGEKWPISGLSKNLQNGGPLAAHVFDQPGTYQVRVRARDKQGRESESTLTVTAQDPASSYEGTRTICVSAARDFTGCPAGAAHQAALPGASSYSGRRVLLRRSESFGEINIPHGSKSIQIGAFGAGDKPTVARLNIGTIRPSSSAFPNDITVMDLNVTGGIEQFVTVSRLLLYRNDVGALGTGMVAQISLASALGYIVQHHTLPANQYFQPREIFVVENRVQGSTANPLMNMVGTGSRFVIMGNDMGTAQQHTVRLYGVHKGFIAHNALRGKSSDGIRVALKLQSGGLGDYHDNYAISRGDWASRQIVISNNQLGDTSDNNSFIGGASPENNAEQSRQGIEDLVLENNRFVRGPKTNTEFILMGRRMTTRGNVRTDGGAPNINQFNNSYSLLPAEWNGPYYVQ